MQQHGTGPQQLALRSCRALLSGGRQACTGSVPLRLQQPRSPPPAHAPPPVLQQQAAHQRQHTTVAGAGRQSSSSTGRGGGRSGGRSSDSSSSSSRSSSSSGSPAAAPRKPPAQPPLPPVSRPLPQQLGLPAAEFSRIRTAVFVSSAVDLRGCPRQTHPEFAVIGRSNVGKSSLINMLTQDAKLAKVSKEPGMTKTINHFLINDSWYLVDLPGYGYAKTAGKESREAWLDFTKTYFIKRSVLVAVLLLVDASIPPQAIDLDCASWLAEAQVPFAVVFTKCDARKKGGPTPAANAAAFKRSLAEQYEDLPAFFETSAAQGLGRSEVLGYLASLRQLEAAEGELL